MLLFKYRNHSIEISSPIYNDLSISSDYFRFEQTKRKVNPVTTRIMTFSGIMKI